MIIHQYAEFKETDPRKPIFEVCLNQFASNKPQGVSVVVDTINPFVQFNAIENLRVRSDSMRIKYMTLEGDRGYADADTTINTFPDFNTLDKSKPWVSQFGGGYITGSVLFSFGHQVIFQSILDKYDTLKYKGAGWLQDVLNSAEYRDQFFKMPIEWFNQFTFSALTGLKNGQRIAGEGFYFKMVDDKIEIISLKGVK